MSYSALSSYQFSSRYIPGLRAGWSRVRVPAGAGNFSLHHCFQTGSWALLVTSLLPNGYQGLFPWG